MGNCVAFSLDSYEPGSLSQSLAQGKENAAERGETPASFGYDQGSPSKYPGPEFERQRFAGDVFKGLGVEGVFGQMSNDRQNVQAQNNLQLFMSQYTNGLFSPVPPAPPMPPA